MARNYSTIKTRISVLLQDPDGAIFSTATGGEIDLAIEDGNNEIPRWVPHTLSDPDIFRIESRTGQATSDTANALVDGTNAQFVSTDVGKVVYNSTDKSWGVVTAYVSTSQLTLSKDLFPDGNESYRMYNQGCKAINQINISDIFNRYDIEDGDRIEYPIGTRRNIDDVEGDILTIGVATIDDSSQVNDANPDVDVHVYFRRRHFISQLTDLLGAVDLVAGYSAGDTSMDIQDMQPNGTIKAGQEFTIAGTRGIYTVTTDATITSNTATISFYPGLENDVAHETVITFKQSTLTIALEPLFCRYVAASAAMSKPNIVVPNSQSRVRPLIDEGQFTINESNKGGPGTPTDYLNFARAEIALADKSKDYQVWGERQMGLVINELSRLSNARVHEVLPRT